jgi:adenosylcobinamide kinase/adenosylcobinamide-phosphate guanylyltransferase
MAGTVCALIGIGHREPQPDRLALCLAAWQAWAPDDGASSPPAGPTGPTGRGGPAGPEPYRRRLVLGGSGSGKSALAEDVLAASPGVVYVATGPLPDPSTPDPDWSRRVDRHRDRRPPWWRTIETQDVAALLRTVEEPLLIDSLGTWLTGVLDRAGAWSGDPGWPDEVAAEVEDLLMAWRTRRGIAVAVSDEVGWGVVPATSAGRLFRDELGRLNRRLADESEAVHLVAVGRLVPLPPGPP